MAQQQRPPVQVCGEKMAKHAVHKKTHEAAARIVRKIGEETGRDLVPESIRFRWNELNSVLVNKYRNFNDSISKHADDEKEFGPRPTIVSVNLGASRTFEVQRFTEKVRKREWDKRQMQWVPNSEWKQKKLSFELDHGDVLIMAGSVQDFWVHGVPKEPDRQPVKLLLKVPGKKKLYRQIPPEIRYNLTFRPYV